MSTKADFFKPENLRFKAKHASPSGKYELVVSTIQTKPGCWNYSQGEVFEVATGKSIAVVQRNYSHFPFLFIEDHPNGHSYLVGGENYQGQTVIELDSGLRKDFLPKEAAQGVGFCWASYTFNRDHQLLIVDGCYWACPYEYKIYDFSDPMNGWPYLSSDDYMDADGIPPRIYADGTVEAFQVVSQDSDLEDEDEYGPIEVVAIKTFKREDQELKLLGEWVSDKEQSRRVDREKAEKAWQEKLAHFRTTDPLYLQYRERLKEQGWKPEANESIGGTYSGWCPGFEAWESRMCRRIYNDVKQLTIDLEWGFETAPIKLVVYRGGKAEEARFFPHSVKGMNEAFDAARKELL